METATVPRRAHHKSRHYSARWLRYP